MLSHEPIDSAHRVWFTEHFLNDESILKMHIVYLLFLLHG